jgi:hypothetical protein
MDASIHQQVVADVEYFLNLWKKPLPPGAGGEICRVHNERSPLKADQRAILHLDDNLHLQARITGCYTAHLSRSI